MKRKHFKILCTTECSQVLVMIFEGNRWKCCYYINTGFSEDGMIKIIRMMYYTPTLPYDHDSFI